MIADEVTDKLLEALQGAVVYKPKKKQNKAFMKTEIIHHLDESYPGGISHTEKTLSIFGIVIKRNIYHYPKLSNYDVVTML